LTNQMTPAQIHQFQQLQQQQQVAQRLQQARTAAGDSATSGVLQPNNMLPQAVNPHNYPIPHDSQQALMAIGVPSDKLMSWNEVINWLQDAFKAGIINDEQYQKVKNEYHAVSSRINTNPQAYYQAKQLQARNAAAGQGNISASNQLLLQQMQARQQQLAGQQSQVPPTMQSTPQTMPPQVQMNMAGIPQLQQQMPQQQPQAPPPQTQPSQQQQQPAPQTQQPQVQNAQQQRKGRAPPKKPAPKKGQDATNPMVIGNTPTPTTMPTPSPAQHAASLPNSTPLHVSSPAGVHLPGSTPQNMSISPADVYANQPEGSQQSDGNINPLENRQLQAQAMNFVRNETDKIKQLTHAQIAGQQPKNLTPEEKAQMAAMITNKQTIECINKMDKLAALFYVLTRDEAKTSAFIRLVFLPPSLETWANGTA
jgi:hypothetical protein